jgi:SAM-dependent methyltransferase
MGNALRYHIEVDLSQENTSHAQLIRLTGRNKQVLEVGPATGYVTKVLQQRGCRVWCIENDAEAAKAAAEFCERMIVANVETVDFKSTFPDERFDVVTFGDVLEHLVDPMGVLMRVKDVLKPGGYVVASVPNIAHASIRLSLLKGQFQYTEMGLLDRTHLRFFTRESLADLFHGAGYEVRAWRRILTDAFATELELQEEDYPPYLREAARADPEAQTYQFVVSAYPARSARNGRRRSSSRGSSEGNVLDDLWRWQKEHHAKEASLAHALAQRNATLADREELLARRERSLQEATAGLAAMHESRAYKLFEAGRQAIRRLFSSGSWRGKPHRLFEASLKKAGRKSERKSERKEVKRPLPATSAPASIDSLEPGLTEAQYYQRQLVGLCDGRGIELSPRHAPMQGLPPDAVVLYLDKESTGDLKARLYPDETARSLVPVDVVADLSCLPFTTNALDFLIASDLIGRLPNPLGALREWHRCLKEGGRLFLTVPDTRFCFDGSRALADWSHLLGDMERNDDGLSDASREHLREWIRNVERVPDDGVDERLEYLLSTTLDYHWHTWTYESMLATLDRCGRELGLRFEREAELNSYETWGEMILVLRKDREAADVLPARYRYPECEFTTKGRILGELLPGTVLEQSFSCARDGLNAIHVRVGTYSRANSGPLLFQLFEEDQEAPLVRMEVDLSELRDNFFHSFRFAPIKKSAAGRFHFTLEAPNASPENAVTVWAAGHNETGVALAVNGSPVVDTTLNFKAFSIASLDESAAWSGQRVAPPSRPPSGPRLMPGSLREVVGKGEKRN